MRRLAYAVVVLVALLLVADRAGAIYASRSISDELQASLALAAPPQVDIIGFPFLTQAIAGRYERVEVRATDVPADGFVLSHLDATLHGAQVPLSDVLSHSVDDLPVEEATARALVPYGEMSQSFAGQGLSVEPDGDRLLIVGDLQLSDQALSTEASASVAVVDGELVVTPEEVGFGGAKQELNDAVREQLELRVPVPALPYDLTLTAVQVRPDGLALRAEGTDVVLTAG